LRFFALQGRHVAPMGVKFETEEGTEGPLLRAKFHPHRCNDKGAGPQKLKILLRFDQNVEYKHSTGAYPLHDFHKISRVCTAFQVALAVKKLVRFARGVIKLWGFKSRGMVSPKFSVTPSGETMRETPKVLEVQERARSPLSPC